MQPFAGLHPSATHPNFTSNRELVGAWSLQLARKNNENFGEKREGWTVPALLTRKNTRLFIIIKL